MKHFITISTALALIVAAVGCGDSHDHKDGEAGHG